MSNKRFYLRYINTGDMLMAAITDEELLGKTVEDKNSGIRIDVRESFYKGELADEEDVIEAMNKADVLILTGDRCIKLAINLGLVNPEAVMRIGEISHVQVMKFSY